MLRRLALFVEVNGWLPSAPELARANVWHGCRDTMWSDLARLRHAGLVESVGRRWSVSEAGFAFLGVPAVRARRDPPGRKLKTQAERRAFRKRARWDAAIVLDSLETVD